MPHPERSEVMSNDWRARATASVATGDIEKWVGAELDNLAWYSTIEAIGECGNANQATTALDVGFGWGRIVVGMKRFYPHLTIDGVELTPEFVSRANQLADDLGLKDLTLTQGDILTTPLPDAHYDLVYATRVLHYIEDKPAALSRLFSTTKPGGKLVVLIPNRLNPIQSMTYEHALYSPTALAKDVREAGFVDVNFSSARFFPGGTSRRADHTSPLLHLERMLRRNRPSRWFGALAIITGTRPA